MGFWVRVIVQLCVRRDRHPWCPNNTLTSGECHLRLRFFTTGPTNGDALQPESTVLQTTAKVESQAAQSPGTTDHVPETSVTRSRANTQTSCRTPTTVRMRQNARDNAFGSAAELVRRKCDPNGFSVGLDQWPEWYAQHLHAHAQARKGTHKNTHTRAHTHTPTQVRLACLQYVPRRAATSVLEGVCT